MPPHYQTPAAGLIFKQGAETQVVKQTQWVAFAKTKHAGLMTVEDI